jgi:site-specific recombinase XerD
MTTDLVLATEKLPPAFASRPFPAVILQAGPEACRHFVEFFTANIRNPNTRKAYARAVSQFLEWCDARALALGELRPFHVAAYVEELPKRPSHERTVTRKARNGRPFAALTEIQPLEAPSVKQHLAAIRVLFDWLVVAQVMPYNPAASVRGPKHVVKRGKTPVLSAEDARRLLDSIPLTRKVRQGEEVVEVPDLVGLRDRALIGVMVYSFARVGAVVGMEVGDYYQSGRRCWIRLHEKGGRFHEVPAHHNAEAYVDAYLEASGIGQDKKTPLFRAAVGRTNALSQGAMSRTDALRMVKRRAKVAGLPDSTCCHTFRATGITAYLDAGGTIENAQAIAAHESPRTTKLYDRTSDELTLDEIERIAI